MILGHFALASVAKQTCFQKENWILLFAASIAPDLMDKPASLLLGLPGRGMGHSLFVLIIVAVITRAVYSRLKLSSDFLFAAVVMWLSHLAGDFVQPDVLFWPFLGSLESGSHFDFSEKLYDFYILRMHPEQFWLEIACIIATLGVWAFRSGLPKFTYASLVRQEVNKTNDT